MFKITLAFYKADREDSSFVDKTIAWWTNSKYSHVEIILERYMVDAIDKEIFKISDRTMKEYLKKGMIKEYNGKENKFDAYQFSSSGTYGGVRIKQHRINHKNWDYVIVKKTNDIEDIKTIINFFKLIQDDKYDWAAIFGFILPLRDRTNRWICSEACANALKIIGLPFMYLLEPAKLSPGGLYNHAIDYLASIKKLSYLEENPV